MPAPATPGERSGGEAHDGPPRTRGLDAHAARPLFRAPGRLAGGVGAPGPPSARAAPASLAGAPAVVGMPVPWHRLMRFGKARLRAVARKLSESALSKQSPTPT